MTSRRAAVGVLFAALAVAIAVGWTRLAKPWSEAHVDGTERGSPEPRTFDDRRSARSGRAPLAAAIPDQTPRSISAPRRRSASASAARSRAGETSTGADAGPASPWSAAATSVSAEAARADAAKPGTISGHVDLPPELASERESLEVYVVERQDLEDGLMTSSWSVPKAIGADGTYTLSSLPPGAYTLQIALRGRAVSEGRRFHLDSGKSAEGVDFHFKRTVTVHGTVVSDTDFKPVEKALVSIVGEPGEPTDATGGFDLFDLPPGTYELFVTHPDHAPAWSTVVVPGDAPPAPISIYLRPGAEARILATDDRGAPAPDVPIDVSSEDHLATAVTDAFGVAWVRGLTPGARYAATVAGPRTGRPAVTLKADPTFGSGVTLTTPP